MTSLYWLSLLLDQRPRQAQAGSGKESLDGPRVLGSCGRSSTGPRVDRCPGGRMGGVNPGPELSSLCWVLFLNGELTPIPCLPQVSQPRLPLGLVLLLGGGSPGPAGGGGGAPPP